MENYIYSEYLEQMVKKEVQFKGQKYTWNEEDLVYYSDCEFYLDLDTVEKLNL